MRESIGRYQLKRHLARGGMASVYLAYDPRFERDVALKVLYQTPLHDPTLRIRFEREGRVVAGLEHPAVVPVYDLGEEDDLLFIVMRYMPGGSLEDRLRDHPMTLEQATATISRLGSALDAVHAQGIVHRDIKPSNVLYDCNGDVFLADFGIARLAEATALFTGSSLIGTPAYMSPEQFHASVDIDGRSDIYALGSVLFEMLTGRQPYPGDSPATYMMGHVMGVIPSVVALNPALPASMDAVIGMVLAKEADDRYQSAHALTEDLARVRDGHVPRAALRTGFFELPPAVPSPPTSATVAARVPVVEQAAPPPPAPLPAPRRRRWRPGKFSLLFAAGLIMLLLAAVLRPPAGPNPSLVTPLSESIAITGTAPDRAVDSGRSATDGPPSATTDSAAGTTTRPGATPSTTPQFAGKPSPFPTPTADATDEPSPGPAPTTAPGATATSPAPTPSPAATATTMATPTPRPTQPPAPTDAPTATRVELPIMVTLDIIPTLPPLDWP